MILTFIIKLFNIFKQLQLNNVLARMDIFKMEIKFVMHVIIHVRLVQVEIKILIVQHVKYYLKGQFLIIYYKC